MDVTDVATARQHPVGLAELARIPLRRWRTVLVAAASVLVAVLVYLFVLPASYTATTAVVVRPVVTDPFSVPSGGADRAVNMTAESGIATSNEVIDKVAAITGRDTEEVADALKVETPVGGQVMRFEYAAHSEREAVDGANGAAQGYLDLRRGIYEKQRAEVLKSYDDTIAVVTAQRTTTQKSLPEKQSTDSPSPRTSALLDQLRALNDQLATLAEQRSKIASADLSPGSITSAARTPVPSSRDSAPLLLVGGVLGGLLLGGLVAFVRESLDRRLRSTAEAVSAIGAPLLGTVRRTRGGEPDEADLRYLALALARWVDGPERGPLVLLSSATDEGREQVTAGLAAVLAGGGHAVRLGVTPESLDRIRPLMLDAQRRNPPVEPAPAKLPRQRPAPATTPASVGVAAPAGGGDPEETAVIPAVRKPRPFPTADAKNGAVYRSTTTDDKTQVIPTARSATAGATTRTDGQELRIGSGTVRLVPLDAPPAADGLTLLDAPPALHDERGVRAARDGRAVLVAARDRTRLPQLTRLVERLRSVGVEPFGFVLTGGHRD
ncbi:MULTISPECIES: lipopolysaccharide biosynthesis protein [Micromonospora]|uniref:Lipopolysaccharide biosynthesis protein n=1 Tax=Micromonospora solifontis TaxID=2487138 RepID=A0ABX9WMB7_9ACTN|nr:MULTISPECIES: lipopolysaccharide biosynthesis protein [Micromonospora]NES13474.1 lipopolysaccharide biosynthesis protein [Micromonospora sp. PPF5-17B]NES35598.1 lipopolysaccharide biosynthesis protein [Micromonospora solifontis]NES55510.1 lipopolysaccharide biosynthesis protein [Micromonospora sp. PPF5-6]RNM00484.1 lipopolysaccharide biosynthesis protein [Micromonospora solifontis]